MDEWRNRARSLEVQRVGDWPEAPGNKALKRWVRAALKGRRGRVGLLIRVGGRRGESPPEPDLPGQAGPTNVLAFPFLPPPGTRNRLLGDSGDPRPGGAGGGDGAEWASPRSTTWPIWWCTGYPICWATTI